MLTRTTFDLSSVPKIVIVNIAACMEREREGEGEDESCGWPPVAKQPRLEDPQEEIEKNRPAEEEGKLLGLGTCVPHARRGIN